MLLWDVSDKLKYPKRGYIIKTSASSSGNNEAGIESHIGLNYLRQKNSIRNGFIAVSNSGDVVRIEVPPVINDSKHKSLLSNPGSKIVWTPEAISFMSNIGNNTGEVIATKSKAEKYLQETNTGGKQTITQIDIDTVINSKPDMAMFYQTPVIAECEPHFHACFKVVFHPVYEYI